MNLKKYFENKEKNIYADISPAIETNNTDELPVFTYDSNHSKKRSTKKQLILALLMAFAVGLLAMISVIYLPQFLIQDEDDTAYITEPNMDALQARTTYIGTHLDADFDNDGMSNGDEIAAGTNVYYHDSDSDGLYDGIDSAPLSYNEDLYYALIENGSNEGSAYEINGVLMWAENKDSFMHGGVIKTISGGYRFNDFTGWVRFPVSSAEYAAYTYENGRHISLEYSKDKDAWFVASDCEVILTKETPEIVYLVSFFGNDKYYRGGFGRFLNALLPERGYITCKDMWLSDTFIDVSQNTIAEKQFIDIDKDNLLRFASNDDSLKSLMNVYHTIDDGYSVAASLMDPNDGEVLIIIYGYTPHGDLLCKTPDGERFDILNVHPLATKALDDSGKVILKETFGFEGLGFSSKSGDTICFFSGALSSGTETESSDDNEAVESSPNLDDSTADEVENTTDDPEISEDVFDVIPDNGIYTVDGISYYYINSLPALNRIIHMTEEGIYEYCEISDAGAFYVDDDGQKVQGLIVIEDSTYCYGENGFIFSSFFHLENESYITTNSPTENSMFCNADGIIEIGWFSLNGHNYYASMQNLKVLINCFVKNDSGKLRYLDSNGRMQKNKLIIIDDIEILLDGKGDIINYDHAKDVINKHIKS